VRRAAGRAPGRVNLIGEHTDYNGGLALPFALDRSTRAVVTAREDDAVRIVSRQVDEAWSGTTADVGSATGWAAYAAGVLWVLRQEGWELPGVDVEIDSTVPLGAGLSSSAALEVSVAVAVAGLLGRELTPALRHDLVAVCRRAETEVAGAPTGGLDQTASLLCRADHALLIDFSDGSTRDVPLRLGAAGLAILVIDTRVHHRHADGGYADRRAECERGDPRRLRHVRTENARVRDAVTALEGSDWVTLGGLLTASHRSLRDDFEVSAPELDTAVDAALAAGALGARMTGGGFGGSAIALVHRSETERVKADVVAAFARAGHGAPGFLLAEPSGPAEPCPPSTRPLLAP
jgi:galactokinase